MSRVDLENKHYYRKCFFAGLFPCAITHTVLTPLDIFKVRRQVYPEEYTNLVPGVKKIYAAEGLQGIYLGYQPTIVGYALQGSTKFGFYEYFKVNILQSHTTLRYMVSSALAEIIADCFLCPWESVKVRMQTNKNFSNSLIKSFAEISRREGIHGFYKGIIPLICRQVPNNMVKFATFENITKIIYGKILKKPKNEYKLMHKLFVTFTAGVCSGVASCLVSNPADTIMSKYNASKTNKDVPLWSSVKSIFKEVGFLGLYRGLNTRILMTGLLSALEWLIYDSFKAMVGLPTTGEIK
jgi:solute carrier family 25 phosphate transporter 3